MFENATKQELIAIAKAAYDYEKRSGVPLMCAELDKHKLFDSREEKLEALFQLCLSWAKNGSVDLPLHVLEILNTGIVELRRPKQQQLDSLTEDQFDRISNATKDTWDSVVGMIVNQCGGRLPKDWQERVVDSGLMFDITGVQGKITGTGLKKVK